MKEFLFPKNNKIFILCMTILLLLQLSTLFYYGTRKQGFHEDELYTFYSTNKTAGLFVNDRQWMSREDLRNDFVVLPGEQFRYHVVKQMQSWDVHPPLYYYIMHTACSFFPNRFSKWLGIGVNLPAYVLSFLLLGYCVYQASTASKTQTAGQRGKRLVFLCCLTWGFSCAVISGVMFIRMYQWLTLFVLLCTAIHLRAMRKQDFRIGGFLLPLAATVFLGFLTQYYYIIFHFFMGVGFCIYLLTKGKIKELLSYAVACAVGLAAALLYYPASLSHIFRGYRGTEAVSEFSNAGNTWERLRFFVGLFDDYVMNDTLIWWLLVLCLLAVTTGYFRKRRKMAGSKEGSSAGSKEISSAGERLPATIGLLLFTCAGYFFTVSKTALLLGETSNRYQLPVYGLLIFLILYALWSMAEKMKIGWKPGIRFTAALAAVLLLMNAAALYSGKVFFLYEEEAPIMEFVQSHTEAPVVVFYHDASSEKIWWLSDELMQYPRVYLASQGNQTPIADETINSSNRLLVYVADYENKEACLERLLESNKNLQEYKVVAQKREWTLYELQ